MQTDVNKILEDLNSLIDIQGSNGNWNYNSYRFGMYNGLMCCRALITGEEPQYKDKPDKYLEEINLDPKIIVEQSSIKIGEQITNE